MPTPGGLLKAGDRLVHDNHPDVVFVVTERTGNVKADYSVWVRREDGDRPNDGVKLGDHWRPDLLRRNGYEAKIMEAHYWVFMTNGGWRLKHWRLDK